MLHLLPCPTRSHRAEKQKTLLETAAELRYCLPQGQAPNIRSLGGPGEEEQAAPYSMGAGRLRYRNPHTRAQNR